MPTVELTATKNSEVIGFGNSFTPSSSAFLNTGRDQQGFNWRTFIGFDWSSIPAGAVITAATLELTGGGNAQGHSIHEVSGAWSEGNGAFTWDTQPSSGASIRNFTNGSWSTVHSLNVLAAAQKWQSGALSAADGLMIRATNESSGFVQASWYPRAHATPANRPRLLVTYASPPTQPGAFTSPTSGQVVDASVSAAWGASTDPDGDLWGYYVESTSNNGGSWTHRTITGGTDAILDTSGWAASTTTRLRVRAKDSGDRYSAWRESPTFTVQHNQPPTAPTLVAPIGNAVIDRSAAQVFDWTINDPDAGDYQTKYDWRYRLVGAGTWTEVINVVTQTTERTVTANTLAAGDYEWQVRTYDKLGVVSPWSGSGFFTAATPPPAPNITSPVNNATIGTSNSQVEWAAPAQDAYQVRTVADNAGAANTGTVYTDSGTVESTTHRNRALTFPVNNRFEHVQVRIRVGGLWSTWASVRVNVSYTPPAAPVITLVPGVFMDVVIDNPAPGAGEPGVIANNIYRRAAGDNGDGIRVATLVNPDSTWTDVHVANAEQVQYRAEAIGDNGVVQLGAWTG